MLPERAQCVPSSVGGVFNGCYMGLATMPVPLTFPSLCPPPLLPLSPHSPNQVSTL